MSNLSNLELRILADIGQRLIEATDNGPIAVSRIHDSISFSPLPQVDNPKLTPKPIIPDTLADALPVHTTTNKFKAEQARDAVASHNLHTRVVNPFDLKVTREDVIDLVTNLKHACNQCGYDWNAIDLISTTHFTGELNELP